MTIDRPFPRGQFAGLVVVFATRIGLNTAHQVIAGLFSQSTALLADAGHNFGLGLVLAWWASRLARSRPEQRLSSACAARQFRASGTRSAA